MKKTALLAVAFATCLGYVPAQAAEVVSSNVVGYNKIDLANTFSLVGLQFLDVGGDSKDIQNFTSDNNLPGLDGEGAFQTELRLWTGTGYKTLNWLGPNDGTALEAPELNSKWYDLDNDGLAVGEIGAGEAAWIKIPSGETASVTFSGEVPDGATTNLDVRLGFTLLANPFPVAMNVQSVQLSNTIPGLDGDGAFQTELRRWTGTGYRTYGWLADGDGTALEAPELNCKWYDLDGDQVANFEFRVGEGFWIVSPKAAGTVTFTK